MSEGFTDAEIRDGMKKVSQLALKSVGKDFQRQLKTKKKQGLEKLYEDQFILAFGRLYPWWKTERQQRRSQFTTAKSQRDGWVDVVTTYADDDGNQDRIGVEFKVCELPRSFATAPKGVRYDLGQLAWDFGELATYKMSFGYCIAILYGGIPSMETATPLSVARSFHNSLFVDAQTAKHFGRPGPDEDPADWKQLMKVLPQMRLNEPFFSERAHPGNFCVLDKASKLAAVGLYVPYKR